MKVYGIFPAFELCGADTAERDQACISLIARLIFDCLRSGGDHLQFSVDWRDPGAPPGTDSFHEDLAEPHIERFEADHELMERLVAEIDPNSGFNGGVIRSIATCRAVTFGYDGQAFLCLRHEDKPPVSSDLTLATVEERPDILIETDYFDGWIRE